MNGIRSCWLLAVMPATVCLTPVMVPFLSLNHRYLYHQDGSALVVLLALFANLFVAWLLFAAVLRLGSRIRWIAVAFWISFLAYLPPVLLRNWGALEYRGVPAPAHRVALAISCGFLCFVAVAWTRLLRPRLEVLLRRLETLMAFLSCGSLVTVLQLAMYAMAARELSAKPMLHKSSPALAVSVSASPGAPRVIWIMMDELGHDPTFVHRMPGLALPAFDAFAAEATRFTAASSPGLNTEEVIPEIILGQAARRIALSSAGWLQYVPQGGNDWHAFDAENTVFADALRNGYRTGVAGWYNPYCRLLAPVLDRCFWTSRSSSVTQDFDPRAPFLQNVVSPAQHAWANVFPPKDLLLRTSERETAMHEQDLAKLLQEGDEVLADRRINFVFLHLPVPHPPGIYERRRGALIVSGHTSYADNLVLADKILAHLRAELVASGEWDGAAVVVMGDHAWRTTQMWKGTPDWTEEDQTASRGGAFDARPVYLVKLPRQHTAAQVDSSFATVRTRDLLDRIMMGRVRTPVDLQQWASH